MNLVDENKEWVKKDQGYCKKILLNEKEIGEEGTAYLRVRFPAGLKIGPHYHKKQTEILYVTKGNAVLTVNKKDYSAEPGKSFIFRHKDLHLIDNSKSQEEFEVIIFKVNEPRENDFFEAKE